MDLVEELFYIWDGNNPKSEKVTEQKKTTSEVVQDSVSVEHIQAIEDTLEDYGVIHQLEGFRGGFETCRRLLLADKRLMELLRENKQIVKLFKG